MTASLKSRPLRWAEILQALRRDGIVVLEDFLPPADLAAMQAAFRAYLAAGCWNSPFGYTNTDNFRWMVEDILVLDEAFQRTALHPELLPVMKAHLGDEYILTEAKGWRSLPCEKDFHGWHNDAWYDRALSVVPAQLKLAIYLTNVRSGAFSYVKGTHGQVRHRHWPHAEVSALRDRVVEVTGKAGTLILFDTSGIHRQSYPIREERDAIFLCYNDPKFPLQPEDVRHYRYHPLHLNAAFLGGLSPEEMRVLGMGNKALLRAAYVRPPARPRQEKVFNALNRFFIRWNALEDRLARLLRRILRG